MNVIAKKTLIAAAVACAPAITSAETYNETLNTRITNSIGWSNELLIRDINQDGNSDMVLLADAYTGMHYLNNGDGTFAQPVKFDIGGEAFRDVLFDDLNGDGIMDVLRESIYPGDTYTNLTYSTSVSTPAQLDECIQPVTVDWNDDNLPDIACAIDYRSNFDDPLLGADTRYYGNVIFENNGGFDFSKASQVLVYEPYLPSEPSRRVEAVVKGSVINGGKDELVQIVKLSSDRGKIEDYIITTYIHGPFTPFHPEFQLITSHLHDTANPWLGTSVTSAQLADINNDGNNDLIVLVGTGYENQATGRVTIFSGNGDGTFKEDATQLELGSPWGSDIRVADVNSDGNNDLVLAYRYTHNLDNQLGTTVFYGNGDGTFKAEEQIASDQQTVPNLDVADINGDGQLDIVTMSGYYEGARLIAYTMGDSELSITTPERVVCESALSDSNGDGWGWENNQSCQVTEDSSNSQPANLPNSIPRNSTHPLCTTPDADVDGDGWGWENQQTCQVEDNLDPTITTTPARPTCEYPWRDYDNDGWGFENGVSCLVRNTD